MEIFNYADYARFKWSDMVMIFRATGVTLHITLVSLFFGTLLGLIFGVIRCSKSRLIRTLPLFVMEPLRNSPLIVQLFLVYYGLPSLGIRMNAQVSAILTLSLNTAAFFGVLTHSSILAVPAGQWEAGYALGFSRASVYVNIIARQAVRLLVPQAITLYIGQLQCSSLIALVSLMDLTKAGQVIAQKTLLPFLVFGIVALIYYILSAPLAQLAKYLDKRIGFYY